MRNEIVMVEGKNGFTVEPRKECKSRASLDRWLDAVPSEIWALLGVAVPIALALLAG